MKNHFDIVTLASNDACFNLQFRRDTRHERNNTPTYYRWKVQFIITGPKESINMLDKVEKEIGCGKIHSSKNQVRFSVQNIDHIIDLVVPFFNKNKLLGNKKKDFELWQKAVRIIYQNKGKHILKWDKNDLLYLMTIQKLSSKYKNNPREPKWIQMAQSMVKSM